MSRKSILNAPTRVSVTTSATLVVNPVQSYAGILIRNLDAAASVYLGTVDVGDGDGFELKAGEIFDASIISSPIYAVTASGTVSLAVMLVG